MKQSNSFDSEMAPGAEIYALMHFVCAKYSCTYCQEDIIGVRAHCAECVDFELCPQCLACGAEIGPHKNFHRYQFMDTGVLSLTRSKNGWTTREAVHLLDAVKQFGFGSWEDISKHIETRNAEDATFITMKAVFLSGRDQVSRAPITPTENKVKNYLIKSGWLKTGYQT